MLTKDAFVALLNDKTPLLAKASGVRRIGLFDPFATGQATEASDIDLAVEYDTPIELGSVDLVEGLGWVPGRTVDLMTPAGVQGISRCLPSST